MSASARAPAGGRLRDCPRDRALVRDADDQAGLAGEIGHVRLGSAVYSLRLRSQSVIGTRAATRCERQEGSEDRRRETGDRATVRACGRGRRPGAARDAVPVPGLTRGVPWPSAARCGCPDHVAVPIRGASCPAAGRRSASAAPAACSLARRAGSPAAPARRAMTVPVAVELASAPAAARLADREVGILPVSGPGPRDAEAWRESAGGARDRLRSRARLSLGSSSACASAAGVSLAASAAGSISASSAGGRAVSWNSSSDSISSWTESATSAGSGVAARGFGAAAPTLETSVPASFLRRAGHPRLLVFVVRVARGAARLLHLVLDHRDHGMIGDAALARTVVVQNVTEPKPALLHETPPEPFLSGGIGKVKVPGV